MASGTVTVDKTDSPVFAPAGYLTHLGKYMETKIKSTTDARRDTGIEV
jgi:hypothetical protein